MFLKTPGRLAPLSISDLLALAPTEAIDLQTGGLRLRRGSFERVRVRVWLLYLTLLPGSGIAQL